MRKIAVVTGTRAEYGLLKPLLKAIDDDKELELQLLVTGMHLMPEFGNTYTTIEKDGFIIDAKVEDKLEGDSSIDITRAIGRALMGFGNVLDKLKPNILLVLGDRSEILASTIAAMVANIPVAHIHGGETTEGAYDEFIRHAITKMSQLHFASTETYRRRILQLGEQPNRVFNVGAVGIDSIRQLSLLEKESFEESIAKKLAKNSVLITFHPVTLEHDTASVQFNELLRSLDELENYTLMFIKPNSDRGGRKIIQMIEDYVSRNPIKAISFFSLDQLQYLSALQFVNFVIGNSSSGILEVPYFRIPTINIGDRQKGRITPESVINCPPYHEDISKAIKKSQTPRFLEIIKNQKNIYGDGHSTEKILEQLRTFDINQIKKSFYDIKDYDFDKL